MKRLTLSLAMAVAVAILCAPAAQAAFDLQGFEVSFSEADGSPVTQAGSHPYAMSTGFDIASFEEEGGEIFPEGSAKDVIVTPPVGLAGIPEATPRCNGAEFADIDQSKSLPSCSDAAAVGVIAIRVAQKPGATPTEFVAPVYNLVPGVGSPLKLGFVVINVPITLEARLSESRPYRILAPTSNISQALVFYGAELTLWGNPAVEAHDEERGSCLLSTAPTKDGEPVSLGSCPVSIPEVPFLTLPRSCGGKLTTTYATDSWLDPGARLPSGEPDLADPSWATGSFEGEEVTGCSKLPFGPRVEAEPTSSSAESPSGLDFELELQNEGFANPDEGAVSASDIKRAVVTLPEGMTVNPSQAEGLGVCSEADLAREKADAPAGSGCPPSSKIGTLEAETPQLPGTVLRGSLYVAKPYENLADDSLLAVYFVIKDPRLGILVTQAAKVIPDPETGQLVTITEDMPQVPLSSVRLHFREGGRSPLVTPPRCGTHEVKAVFTPWARPSTTYATGASFQVSSGVGGSSCPAGGTPPFAPGFEAGSENNAAGAYSPFLMRWTRRDGDQDLTRFSAELPPGMVAKLAGATQCPEAGIARARSRTGQNGGSEEKADPSCPASSQIGRAIAGAGVGSELTYVPGRIYLAGPYNGAPLSAVGIVPAVAGPFDVGTVVTRFALRIDPRTAEVSVDGSASDPIPHILAGIPLKVRDIRAYVDRPQFTLNPTSCDPSQVGATLWGGGSNVFSSADDTPLSLATRFQAAGCASLGFAPRLNLRLKGGTKRGGFPKLTGTYRPRAGDANLEKLVLRLPRSAFLEQAHIGTICTRVQFAADACPARSVYGHARAFTPLLSEPLEGPVYLRSSNNNLPDFVASLHGLIDVEAVARIDSVRGGIRATFTDVPDAPLSKVVVEMQGGKKGLIVNSTNLCRGTHRANAAFSGHNGKRHTARPELRNECARKAKRGKARRSGARG